jgi:hypothetical protein
VSKLIQAERILDGMLVALLAEQQAVAQLDANAMAEARTQKELLAAELTTLGALVGTGDKQLAANIKSKTTRVLHLARANAALLADATQALSARLGLNRPSAGAGTYNRRGARMQGHSTSLMGGRL